MDGTMAGMQYVFADHGARLIGRSSNCDVRLPCTPEFSTASRHHCLLEIISDAVWVRDLGSRNGTFINGLRISSSVNRLNFGPANYPLFTGYALEDGDELSVAGIVFRVGIDSTDDSPERLIGVAEEPNALALAKPSVN
jgi:pSer/pThr/pTyr-binding forkhead associated (FHA) protein